MAKPKKKEGHYTIAELAEQIATLNSRAGAVWDHIEHINDRLRLLEGAEVAASGDAPAANKITREAAIAEIRGIIDEEINEWARRAIVTATTAHVEEINRQLAEVVRAELQAEAKRNPMFRYNG